MFFQSRKWILLIACSGLLIAGCAGSKSVTQGGQDEGAVATETTGEEAPTEDAPAEDAAADSAAADEATPDAEAPSGWFAPAVVSAEAYYARCNGELRSMADILRPLTQRMHDQRIPYTQNPSDEWRDCSGNFLRLSSYVAAACLESEDYLAAPPGITDYAVGGNNKAPGREKARDTRTLGKWYHEQGRFIPIYYDGVTDISQAPPALIEHRELIKPGAVVWFARKKPSTEDGLDGLWYRGASGAHINHMGTVRAVTRDEEGNVISYEMYHGRNPRKPAAITKHHYWAWPSIFTLNGQQYPPFGYWNQFLVGIGTLLPVEAPPAVRQ